MSDNKVVSNAKWIILCRIAQAIVQLIIGMLCARYLGPSNYGMLNYVSAIVAFVVPIMQMGLQSTLIQEFIDNPEKEGQVMGTSLCLSLISGLACFILVNSFVYVTNRTETDTVIVCILYSTSLINDSYSIK